MNTKLIITFIVLIIIIGAVAFLTNKKESVPVINEPVSTFVDTQPETETIIESETQVEIKEPMLETQTPEFPKTGENPE